jgi:hypothetical protein
MSGKVLHVVFGVSAAGSLREGLKLAGRPDEVVGLQDDLSCGPPDSADMIARRAFIEDVLGCDFDDDQAGEIQAFWRHALDPHRDRIVWWSRWATMEYCGFLEWLRRNGDTPFRLVDLSDASLPTPRQPDRPRPVGCVSLVNSETFRDHALWSWAVPPSQADIDGWRALWDRLRSEAAPLRALIKSGLISAPLDYFDDDLLKHIGLEWVNSQRVVGSAMAAMMLENFRDDYIFQCNDYLLFSRLRALAGAGVVEADRDPCETGFQVRHRQ